MAVPIVVDVTAGDNGGSDASSTTVTLPGSLAVGQRLLVIICGAWVVLGSTFPAGWNEIADDGDPGASGNAGIAVAWHDVDGSEGASIVVSHATNVQTAWFVVRYSAYDSAPPEAVAGASGTSVNPDSPSLTGSWGGSDGNLFIAIASGIRTPGGNTISAYPADYDDNQTLHNGTNAYGAIATRHVASATDNPGAWTLGNSDTWAAATVVQRGAVPIEAVAAQTLAGITNAATLVLRPLSSPLRGIETAFVKSYDGKVIDGANGPHPMPLPSAILGLPSKAELIAKRKAEKAEAARKWPLWSEPPVTRPRIK